MTLIELLVAMVIGLGVTLAVSSLVVVGENHKRTTTSTNDAEQTGAYAFYALDRALRGAGSGIAESGSPIDHGVLGCILNAAPAILPRKTPFPAPFNTAFLTGNTASLGVVPLAIAQGKSDDGISDVLVVMGGSGAAGGVSRQVTNVSSATALSLDNTVGFMKQDLALVSQNGTPDCLLEIVGPTSPAAGSPSLPLDSASPYYYTTTAISTSLVTLAGSTSTYVTPLGNAAANNVQFQLFGVGAGRTLYSYDLLRNLEKVAGSGGDTAQAIADGVDQLHAIYGISTLSTGVPDTWVNPDAASGFDIAAVMTSPAKMKQILAVRVALVLRGNYYDKNQVSPATLTLFGGLTDSGGNPVNSVKRIVTLSAATDDQHYRYRVFEFTVPLRNMLLLAGAPPPGP